MFSSCKDLDSNHLSFDQNVWKTGDFRARGRMLNDLLKKNILRDKKKTEILSMLGESDEENSNWIKYAIDNGLIHERWMQRNFLYLEFDSENKVKEIGVVDS